MAENKHPALSPEPGGKAAWFCLKSQPKHEHIAAAHLRQTGAAEVFLPRVRFKRATRQGRAWVTEALFPGYLFARFDWQASLRLVRHSRGVSGVVHFGERWPVIPDEVIRELQQAIGDADLRVLPSEFSPGDEVKLVDGAMSGLRAVVTRLVPARERVAVLMDFLGRQTTIEVPVDYLVKEGDQRAAILR